MFLASFRASVVSWVSFSLSPSRSVCSGVPRGVRHARLPYGVDVDVDLEELFQRVQGLLWPSVARRHVEEPGASDGEHTHANHEGDWMVYCGDTYNGLYARTTEFFADRQQAVRQ